MSNHWVLKLIIYTMMLGILCALGSGLFFLLFKGHTEQTVKALTYRIGLSVGLFILLALAFLLGWIEPQTVFPGMRLR